MIYLQYDDYVACGGKSLNERQFGVVRCNGVTPPSMNDFFSRLKEKGMAVPDYKLFPVAAMIHAVLPQLPLEDAVDDAYRISIGHVPRFVVKNHVGSRGV